MKHRALVASTLMAACLVGILVPRLWALDLAAAQGRLDREAPALRTRSEERVALAPRSASPSPERAVLPPAARPRRLLVLHGACMTAESTFARLEHGLPTEFEASAPAGNARCRDGSADWVGTGHEKAGAFAAELAGAAEHENVLVGFSRGAFVARDVALARPSRFSGLVLIGASMKLDVDALRAAGVRRVVLASGELDSAYASMRRNREVLERGGVAARFVSLGRVYHTLPSDTGERLREALAWVAGSAPPS